MFKLIQVVKPLPRPAAPMQNTYQTFVVAMPAKLMPILQRRVFAVFLKRLHGDKQPHDLSYQELSDLELTLNKYTDIEAHNMIVNGREWSLLKRFLEAERVFLSQSRGQVASVDNVIYWNVLTDFLLSVIRPTQVVNLSFLTR